MVRSADGSDAAGSADGVAAGNAEQAQAWNGDDGRYWAQEAARHDAMLRHFTPHLLAALPLGASSRVLDIGCGGGETTTEAARVASDGAVLGVDLSGPLLEVARRRAAADGWRQVTYEKADAQVHRFARGGFDCALSRFGVMFFADPAAAFGNIAGGLRSGGRLAFLCWRALAENAFLNVPFAAVAPYLPVPDFGEPGAPGPFSLADADRIREVLTGAGYDEIAIGPVDEPMRMGADPEDVISYQLGLPMARSMFPEGESREKAQALAALREALAEHQGPEGVMLGGAAWLVTARRP
ncbi:class I SAM-dependent methyltransferase [Streptomyces sp. NPDC017993]|uniref:class I SAM-dependent methyltransferase n=1 Tax=Streptomyces sp. NPDC017993 TaxID=3365027 RepID=UPI0037945F14